MDELDVVDFSKGIKSGLDLGVRLSEGIPVLNAGESVVLQPDMDCVGDDPEEEERGDYYSRTLSNLQHLNFNEKNDFDVTDCWSDQKLKMIPLTADGGVYKWKTNTGGRGSGVPFKACVTLFYEAMIEGQDEPFDSSFIRGIAERFKLDCNQLLPGMEIIIKTMNEGETTIGILSPEYAYGRHGVPPR
ncbi:inactive peptidyl-prolyl cis-trans isomerase shutdown isoform X2 [Eurytemora carolleeae]|uniref:inactive peptidyl-prolyl cis-trans isomerase shutdown isoform X2 n=1 Tax=Eurytemora carolleeae TaxID=1294199 RepID=UPI000C75B5AF|nr:inactive peptidyl-prolyl cis-trans isomerase shutdown isoform X2 [Eurytemora carolleeae]|eukprot:XP_023344654.1 inactive peptidyl-prolyl cis-trans isomerase shutdown-like isoform X2 [Eurytemora affinis]